MKEKRSADPGAGPCQTPYIYIYIYICGADAGADQKRGQKNMQHEIDKKQQNHYRTNEQQRKTREQIAAQTPRRRPPTGHSFRKGFTHVAIY